MAIGLPAGAATVPSANALAAFHVGQAYERLFQDHIVPGTCGIVLERPGCNADFEAVHALRGPDANDTATQAWLATGNLSQAAKGWNGIYVPDKSWTEDPEFAWWYNAGIISVATSLPQSSATTDYLAGVAGMLAAHGAATPADFQGLVRSQGSPFDRLQPLQAALLKAVPVIPYPDPSFADGLKGDVQLGIYVSTLQQLLDNPLALSRPESRAFGTAIAGRLQSINDGYAVGVSFAPIVTALSGNISDNPGEMNQLRELLAKAISTKWPAPRRQAFLIGALSAQVAYNAAVLHDGQSDAAFRHVIGMLPPYAGASSQVIADVNAMLKIPPASKGGSWSAINAAASKAVSDMVATPS